MEVTCGKDQKHANMFLLFPHFTSKSPKILVVLVLFSTCHFQESQNVGLCRLFLCFFHISLQGSEHNYVFAFCEGAI